jgi:hypothetical protein
MELIVPLEPAEIEPVADVAPTHVEVEAAPEGAAAAELERGHVSVPEAIAWFENARSSRRPGREAR